MKYTLLLPRLLSYWIKQLSVFILCVFVLGISSSLSAQTIDELAPHFNKQIPSENGTHPVVLLFAGCTGFLKASERATQHYKSVENILLDSGFVTMRVDILSAIRRSDCNTSLVDANKMETVVKNVVEYVTSLPEIDPDNINFLGWSFGGTVILNLLKNSESLNVKNAISYYPNCLDVKPWSTNTNVLLLLGEDDFMTPARTCLDIVPKSKAGDLSGSFVFENALHLFDFSTIPEDTEYLGYKVGYNKYAAEQAWNHVEALLSPE